MNMFWLLGVIFCYGIFIGTGTGFRVSTSPNVVNIGAILSFNSSIGKVAKVAIEAAVGTKLKLPTQDTKQSSGFLGIIEGTSSLKHLLFVRSQFSHCFL